MGLEANPAAQIGGPSANFSGANSLLNFRLVLLATPMSHAALRVKLPRLAKSHFMDWLSRPQVHPMGPIDLPTWNGPFSW